jgi:hypothetical protein
MSITAKDRKAADEGKLRLRLRPAPVCLKVFADYSEDLHTGALVIAEPGRILIRQTVK